MIPKIKEIAANNKAFHFDFVGSAISK